MILNFFGMIVDHDSDSPCPLRDLIDRLDPVEVGSNVSDNVYNLTPYHIKELIERGILLAKSQESLALNPSHYVRPGDVVVVSYAPLESNRKTIDDYFLDVDRNPWKKLL